MITLPTANHISRFILLTGVLTLPWTLPGLAQKPPSTKGASPNKAASVQVRIVPVGTTPAQLDAVDKVLPQSRAVAALLPEANYRHLYTEALAPAGRFRAVFYDYTRQRAIVAEGSLDQPEDAVAHIEKNWQPAPNDEEFQDAVAVLMSDPAFGPALISHDAVTYRPMPPVQGFDANGAPATERIVNVGFAPKPGLGGAQHEIVGVNLGRNTIVRYPSRAPRSAYVANQLCGIPSAGQPTTRRGTAGQYQLTVTDTDGNVLWDMLVLRPSISSGTNASGIELQNVKYKDHSVLKRAHVPILNVQYSDGECGPYRDWQYQEGMFQADGTDIVGAPGFRDCGTTPATTALENGTDSGNFRGVALYREGSEVVLVTELEAGWYRYIHEWRFDLNGTIHPRFGFGATANSCTCFNHTHHAYFRFDFDVDGTSNSISELPLSATAGGALRITTEQKIFRAGNPAKHYRISGRKRSYLLYPGANDGAADTYGRGDMWFLHWHDGPTSLAAEIDDGHGFFDPTEADLDQFLTGESLRKQDSVIWYHASFLHTPDNPADGRVEPAGGTRGAILSGPEVVGPDLVPDGY
jgi:hypothetical protein